MPIEVIVAEKAFVRVEPALKPAQIAWAWSALLAVGPVCFVGGQERGSAR